MNTDAVDATTRFCPVCLAKGKGQYPLRRTEITGGGLVAEEASGVKP